jgi:hypothetical protein
MPLPHFGLCAQHPQLVKDVKHRADIRDAQLLRLPHGLTPLCPGQVQKSLREQASRPASHAAPGNKNRLIPSFGWKSQFMYYTLCVQYQNPDIPAGEPLEILRLRLGHWTRLVCEDGFNPEFGVGLYIGDEICLVWVPRLHASGIFTPFGT